MSLPVGFRVRVHDDVQSAAAGEVLVGGSPLRAVRLSARARSLIHDGEVLVADAATAALADRLLDANIALPVLDMANRAAAAELTVVIPVRDRPEQLDRALAGLRGLSVSWLMTPPDDPAASLRR